jgi:D-serine deaminase-like pyridoxal phosphate-dependent protein
MIERPTLLISKTKVERNINRMLEKAVRSNVLFRPHFKTHQSAEVGKLFRKRGIDKITVSSVSMAEYFAGNGWSDITIAFPINLLEINKINHLSKEVNLNLLVDSVYSTIQLDNLLKARTGLFVEIDNGYHRSGLLPEQIEEIEAIISTCENSRFLEFNGFLTHAGNTYSAKGKTEIMAIMKDAKTKLTRIKQRYLKRFPNIIISYGDTPSCSLADEFKGFDEVRPGNFVYFDVMQYHIGSCSLDDIAVAVACPVVSVYPHQNELVIYGGAVHLSKESIAADNNFKLFGYVFELIENRWTEPIPGAYVSSLSQEHGIIKMPEEFITRFKPGDILGILPIHSCLTADLLKDHPVII